MQLAVRLVVTVFLFFSVWLCLYGYQVSGAIEPFASKAFVLAFGVGSAVWIIYSIATVHRAEHR
jgi:hypothetical protein